MSPCIIYPRYRLNGGTGYGQLTAKGVRWLAHRYHYVRANGPIPEGMFVCHRCNNKGCINPEHLYAATHQQNIIDASRDGLLRNQNTGKTCCSNCAGAYSFDARGHRFCKECKKASNRITKKRRKAAIRAAREGQPKSPLDSPDKP
jgi:hypothetical protein